MEVHNAIKCWGGEIDDSWSLVLEENASLSFLHQLPSLCIRTLKDLLFRLTRHPSQNPRPHIARWSVTLGAEVSENFQKQLCALA